MSGGRIAGSIIGGIIAMTLVIVITINFDTTNWGVVWLVVCFLLGFSFTAAGGAIGEALDD